MSARRSLVGCKVGLLASPPFPRGETGGAYAWQLNPITIGMWGTGLPTHHPGLAAGLLASPAPRMGFSLHLKLFYYNRMKLFVLSNKLAERVDFLFVFACLSLFLTICIPS